jgi:MFS family permease
LDGLLWGRFHWLLLLALGIAWIIGGLEVTLAGPLTSAIEASLHPNPDDKLGNALYEIGNSAYLLGAASGALCFGRHADRSGRKKLFVVPLIVYGTSTLATVFSLNLWMLVLCRFFMGAGIGGEYAAINSLVQELIPVRYRGRAVLAVNGSFCIGAGLDAAGSIVVQTNFGGQ